MNCGVDRHDLSSCTQAFIMAWPPVTPALGVLNGVGVALRRWIQRVISCRISDSDKAGPQPILQDHQSRRGYPRPCSHNITKIEYNQRV